MTMTEIGEALIAGSRLSWENVMGIGLILFLVSFPLFAAWLCAENLAYMMRVWQHDRRMRRYRRGIYARRRRDR